ncbi:unnamed protein product [Rotaria sordida]|uniref:Uncharacterized protein n=2 Tax=Rotaria sordida TaxID=392033 RepID=A0A814BGB1_9BILA|nr:unnamed protein product [Rotaria sordida]
MLSTRRQPSRSFRVIKLHRHRRHRSSQNHRRQSLTLDISPIGTTQIGVRSSSKIRPLNDDKFSSATTFDHHSLPRKRSSKRSSIVTHSLNINSYPSRRKQRKERRNFGAPCRFCTPLCVTWSVLAAALLVCVVATISIAILVKDKSPITIASITTLTAISTTSSTSTTTSRICGFSCLNQTWISSSGLLAKWTFNGTFHDEMNTYTAIAMNNPSFISNGYVNRALVLNATSNQYLYTSYIPLINASFTVELWLYPTGWPNPIDHAILGLCTNPSNDQCLHLTIRNFTSIHSLYMSFAGDNCESNESVPLNTWTHAAFVFDKVTLAMSMYRNGNLVGYCISALPLQGIENNVTIGYIPGIVAVYGSNFFQGYIDQLTIVNRAKSACEILDDATLATYYNFDNSPILNDSGPNSLPSTSQSVSFTSSGYSSKAISFNNSTSYFQISGLTGLGTTNKSFSISLWIRPHSLSGTIVYVSSTAVGAGWCLSFIGFATNGSIVAQIWNGPARTVFGPALSISSVWYHIVETWSSINGLRLYIDSVLIASNPSLVTYTASSASNYVRLANRPNNSCAFGEVGLTTAFYGDIDDFRIYSRELAIDDICAF